MVGGGGGGHVAQRRCPALGAAGAEGLLVSRSVTPAIEGLGNEISIELREFVPSDLDEAWYAIAATDDPSTNAAVAEAAEERRIFCVRSDDARAATAWTPATGRHGSVTVAVLGDREPRRSATIRDEIITALSQALITPTRDRAPGAVRVGGSPGSHDLVTVAPPPP